MALFPYNDSCHVNYSAQNYLCPKKTSIVAVPIYRLVSSRDAYTITSYENMPISVPCHSGNGYNNNGIIAVWYICR